MIDSRASKNNLNLIRLLAALQVLALHGLNHLKIEGTVVVLIKVVPGVPVFFFISGLLIYASFDRTESYGLSRFFINRFLRIYPALWVCIAVSSLAVFATGYLDTQSFSAKQFALWLFGQSSFFQFYNPEFMRAFGVGVLNGALWTIAVELQFYALTPLLVFLFRRCPTYIALFFLLSLATNVYLHYHSDWSQLYIKIVSVTFIPWIYMFILGCAATHYRKFTIRLDQRLQLRWLIPIFVLSMILIGSYKHNASNAINPISYFLLACCLLKLSTADLPLPNRFANLIAREDISYGLYLYHMPIINLLIYLDLFPSSVNMITLYCTSVLAAALSWYFIEKPALRRKAKTP